MARIAISCEDSILNNCDLVIEAVVEREDTKANVFRSLDRVVQGTAILASNTSSLSVSRMAQVTERPTKVAGLHFFNPVRRMELVEIVRTSDTSDETVARLAAFVRSLGKTPIVTMDSPGFLVNRVLCPYLGEAIFMVEEGFSVVEIDQQIRRFGMPMGPLELLDHVGLDVAYHVAKSLNVVLPGAMSVIDKLAAFVQAGQLGQKTSRGFYEYRHGKRRAPATIPFATAARIDARDDRFAEDGLTGTQRRLIYPMLAESVRCLEQKVVAEAWMVDLAMVSGTGFAPHLGGPLHVVDAVGADRVIENLSLLREQFGERFAVPHLLLLKSQQNEPFMARRTSTQPIPGHEAETRSPRVGNRLLSVKVKESFDER
jgi:3-hydroxyacyl-CoA dehydrogenase/enoyl-CoA hydratase/3-hydroxybutyryl-CoA epimerase